MKKLVAEAKSLRLAASLVADAVVDRSCLAIDVVVGAKRHSTLRGRYVASLLAGEENPYRLPWPSGPDSVGARDVRVLLLCFAAEMALSGDLRRSLSKTILGRRCRRHPGFYGMRYFINGDPNRAGVCAACTDEQTDARRNTPKGKRAAIARTALWRSQNYQRTLTKNAEIHLRSKKANRIKFGRPT